jgi:addiction module RelB/DinJ family antitoxin
MNSAVINIKTDPNVKEEAQKTAEQLGISLSSILNAYLRQFVKTKSIAFSAKELDEVPNAYFKQALHDAREHRKQGDASPIFTDNIELIKKDPKMYRHVDTMQEWLHKQGV